MFYIAIANYQRVRTLKWQFSLWNNLRGTSMISRCLLEFQGFLLQHVTTRGCPGKVSCFKTRPRLKWLNVLFVLNRSMEVPTLCEPKTPGTFSVCLIKIKELTQQDNGGFHQDQNMGNFRQCSYVSHLRCLLQLGEKLIPAIDIYHNFPHWNSRSHLQTHPDIVLFVVGNPTKIRTRSSVLSDCCGVFGELRGETGRCFHPGSLRFIQTSVGHGLSFFKLPVPRVPTIFMATMLAKPLVTRG